MSVIRRYVKKARTAASMPMVIQIKAEVMFFFSANSADTSLRIIISISA